MSSRPSRLNPFTLLSAVFLFALLLPAQDKVVWSEQEKPIVEQLRGLRKLDDSVRVQTIKNLALQIRALPKVPNKLRLAEALANLSTEGDFGRDTLQEVTTTLASALREQPPAAKPGSTPIPTLSWHRSSATSICKRLPTTLNSPQPWPNSKPTTPSARTLTLR